MKLDDCIQGLLTPSLGKKICELALALWFVMTLTAPPALSDEGQLLNGHPIPGVSFLVFLNPGKSDSKTIDRTLGATIIDTVVRWKDNLHFDTGPMGLTALVDLIYPSELHDEHNDYPLLAHHGHVRFCDLSP